MARAGQQGNEKVGHVPKATSVGLDAGNFLRNGAVKVLPVRKVIQPAVEGSSGRRDVYVGQGHYTHRQPTTNWATPGVEGQHGTREDCLIYYGNHFRGSGLTREAWELRGHNLWCSYLRAEPCVVDELIAAVYEE